jgi:hypothetical protein
MLMRVQLTGSDIKTDPVSDLKITAGLGALFVDATESVNQGDAPLLRIGAHPADIGAFLGIGQLFVGKHWLTSSPA